MSAESPHTNRQLALIQGAAEALVDELGVLRDRVLGVPYVALDRVNKVLEKLGLRIVRIGKR